MKKYYVYILTNKKDGVLYIGFTDDLERRIREHKLKEVKGFTQKYNLDQLVYFEEYDNSYKAFERERRLKVWKRQWKIDLIENENLNWSDLAKDWI